MDFKTLLLAGFADIHQSTRCWHGVYVAIFVFVGLIYCYNRWSYRRIYEIAAKLPGPKSYPLIGSMYLFYGSTQTIFRKVSRMFSTYGPEPFKLWFGSNLCVAIVKPADIQIVLNNSNSLEKGFLGKMFKMGLGEGLITAPVHKWRKHRRIISPMFNANSVNQLFPIFITKSQNLMKMLKKELGKTKPFELWDYIVSYNLDLVCQTTMGYGSNDATSSILVSSFTGLLKEATEMMMLRICRPWLYPNILYTVYLKIIGKYKLIETFQKLPLRMINEKRKEIQHRKQEVDFEEKKSSNILLDALLGVNDSNCNLSDEEIKDEVISMLTADKVYDEIYEVLGGDDQTITIEQAFKLVYLEQVLKETLRIYTVAPLIVRKLRDDVTIDSGNQTLPKGTLCLIGLMFTHRLPDIYSNPLTFNPDNFSEENIAKRHKYSYVAFSGGPRNCIGYKFAMLSMKVVMSTLLRNFSVHTDMKESDIIIKIEVILKSIHGFPVTIRPRDRRPTYHRN